MGLASWRGSSGQDRAIGGHERQRRKRSDTASWMVGSLGTVPVCLGSALFEEGPEPISTAELIGHPAVVGAVIETAKGGL